MDRFHSILNIERMKPPYGNTWSGGRLTKIQATSRPDYLWPEVSSDMSASAEQEERRHWASGKPKPDNARKLRRIYQIDLDNMEFWDTRKHAPKKLEVPLEPAVPCKSVTGRGETCCANSDIRKTRHARIVEAHDTSPRERAWERLNPDIMKIFLLTRGFNSLSGDDRDECQNHSHAEKSVIE